MNSRTESPDLESAVDVEAMSVAELIRWGILKLSGGVDMSMQSNSNRPGEVQTALPVLRPSQVQDALVTMILANQPVMVVGKPGIGKSRIGEAAGREVADSLGLTFSPHNPKPSEDEYGYLDIRATLLDPVDLRGLPSVGEGRTLWNPPVFLPVCGRGVINWDEVNAAPLSMQTALYQLILDGRCGEYKLPAGWSQVGMGNRLTDGATALKMPTALANRFLHLDMDVDLEDWTDWALKSGIHPMVVAFLRFRPNLLHLMPASGERAFPSPRSWEFVSRVMMSTDRTIGGRKVERAIRTAMVAGSVGNGAAVEFTAFMDLYEKLPDLDSLIANPKRSHVPEDPSTRYAVAFALASRATKVTFSQILLYLERMPEEYGVLSVKAATTRDSGLCSTREFTEWATRHADAFPG